ncbi:MAG: GntR family transcriptional regulator [Anaerovoracaceae bacterium]
MFQIDLKSRKSIYEQVVDNIKDLIITGVIKAEDKIPSVRELSKILTVNPNTVQKAYRELEYQGFLYTVSGLGTFVASKGDIQMNEKKIDEIKEHILVSIKELQYLGLSLEQIKETIDELLKERSNLYD